MTNLICSKKFPSKINLFNNRRTCPQFPHPKVKNNILEVIGNTPLVALNHPEKLLKDLGYNENTPINCRIYAKLEYLNPGGSIKDRIGNSMMVDAKNAGLLSKNRYLLEPTSGNTGAAIAMNASLGVLDEECAGCKIVTTLKCSDEKISVMKLLGAQVCLVKNSDEEMAVVDQAIHRNPEKYVVLDQFSNHINPITHYKITAEEIREDLNRWPDMMVMVAGSGGTFTGIATKLKEQDISCVILAGDPEGSALFHKEKHRHPFLVEGITGGPAPPINLDISLVDKVQVLSDKESFLTARNLAKYEGILCGGSSGLAVGAAIKEIVENKEINVKGKDVVVILPDGIRNYMTKFVLDQWMEAHLFKEIPQRNNLDWYNYKIKDDKKNLFLKVLNSHKIESIDKNTTSTEVLEMFCQQSHNSAAFVVDEDQMQPDGLSPIVGLVTSESFRYHMTNPTQNPWDTKVIDEHLALSDPVVNFMAKEVFALSLNKSTDTPELTVGLVARMLDVTSYVVLGTERKGVNEEKLFYAKYLAISRDILYFRKQLNSHSE